jgi:uncharacterized protein (TIGR02391 family)
MAKRSKPEVQQFTEIRQFRSAEEIELAIAKLKRRRGEVETLKGLLFGDQQINNAAQNIRITILDIFGPNSPEYGEHRGHEIYHAGPNSWHLDGEAVLQFCFQEGIPQTIKLLDGLVVQLQEKLDDLQRDTTARARSAFESLDLHSRIAGVSAHLYRDGHYKQAVLDGSIALVNYVKEKSGQHSLDGSKLMTMVFSANSPLLGFNEMKDQTDRDEQEGFMHLFQGAVLALRNPRAHTIFDDSPEIALDCIAFLSMLAKRLEDAKRR